MGVPVSPRVSVRPLQNYSLCRHENMIDLHAGDADSDEEPPELTDSDDSDASGSHSEIPPDFALERKVRAQDVSN